MSRWFCFAILWIVLNGCEQREEPAIEPVPEERSPATAMAGEEKLPWEIDLQTGQKVYRQVCATCHEEGIAGALQMGDRTAWQPSIAKGLPALVQNSIQGFQGNRGVMPPKGGAKSLTDQEVASAVAYMVEQNR